ncbi:restriction endonuclease subunit S [Pectobacterium aquaticum]|uniref:restriction endonuclease subunit S n=1 Tax=Pectobacterium TaxID=122277 RepID=UPI000E256115|nr:restriction endonuclease subunit S [Pectobacterium aquaticum]RRN90423.1 restriction endonuclease subunit S [Pectobacterium aquaticum]
MSITTKTKFPSHWDVLPFTKALKDATAGNVKIQKAEYADTGEIPIVDQGQSLYGGYTDDHNAICKSHLPTIIFGDHTRAFKYIDTPFALGADGAKVLEPIANLDKRFLFHYLKQLKIESAGYSRHFKFLKETYVPVPPITEQKRIAAILDKSDAIRRKREQAIQLADNFLRAVFLDMFGDPVTNPKGWHIEYLPNLGTFKNGLNYGKEEAGANISYLGVGDFKSLDRIEGVHTLSSIQLNAVPPKDYFLKDGDLVFVRSNGNKALVGRCIAVYPGNEKLTFSGFCIRFRISDEEISTDFLNYLFRMPSVKNEMLKGGQGANIQNINQKKLSEIAIPIPPRSLQKKFSETVRVFKLIQAKSNVNSNEIVNLLKAVSQKTFSGQL